MLCYLFYDGSKNPNVRYITHVNVEDPLFAGMLEDGRSFVLSSTLEYARLKAVKQISRVFCTDDYPAGAKRVEMLASIFGELGVTDLVLPASFPAGLYLDIKQFFGEHASSSDKSKPDQENEEQIPEIKLSVAKTDDVLKQRECKTAEEQGFVRASNAVAAGAINLVRDVLVRSRIVNDSCGPEDLQRFREIGPHLYDPTDDCVVTSESLIKKMRVYCLQHDCELPEVIVSSGDDGVRVHFAGSGPIRPNSLVVVDVFPRSLITGYWGDMTRTFLKGTATLAQRKQVEAVREAQLKALSLLRAGVKRREVALEVIRFFRESGFETGRAVGPDGEECFQGFFHGLSHGVGLGLHEFPGINSRQPEDAVLEAGNVISVEPGLYYLGTGGCRWEDVVAITDDGYEMLSDCPYDWEIP